MIAIKIKTYKLAPRGTRGGAITLPLTWIEDLGLKKGDRIDVYRDSMNRLIVVPPGISPCDENEKTIESIKSGKTQIDMSAFPDVVTQEELETQS